MTVTELVRFEVEVRGVKIIALAKTCDVSVYIIRSVLDGRKISGDHSEKIANSFGYKHSDKLIKQTG